MAMRVLVVDDALFMRQMLRKILEKLGCQVVAEANDGVEALAQFEKHSPDLMTLDLVMPNMAGVEVIRRLRAVNKTVKIMVVSALNQRQALLEALREGADDYVVKPFDAARIETSLSRLAVAIK